MSILSILRNTTILALISMGAGHLTEAKHILEHIEVPADAQFGVVDEFPAVRMLESNDTDTNSTDTTDETETTVTFVELQQAFQFQFDGNATDTELAADADAKTYFIGLYCGSVNRGLKAAHNSPVTCDADVTDYCTGCTGGVATADIRVKKFGEVATNDAFARRLAERALDVTYALQVPEVPAGTNTTASPQLLQYVNTLMANTTAFAAHVTAAQAARTFPEALGTLGASVTVNALQCADGTQDCVASVPALTCEQTNTCELPDEDPESSDDPGSSSGAFSYKNHHHLTALSGAAMALIFMVQLVGQ